MRTSMQQGPNEVQAEIVRRMMAADGRLFRVAGGRWTCEGVGTDSTGEPRWHVPTQTVRLMEARGWIARANKHPQEWRDDRVLTLEGRAIV